MTHAGFDDRDLHPLAALAIRLVPLGLAGCEGSIEIHDGRPRFTEVSITAVGVRLTLRGDDLEVGAELPASLASSLAGRRLVSVVSLPSCGDASVDDAVAGLLIASGECREGPPPCIALTLAAAPRIGDASTG